MCEVRCESCSERISIGCDCGEVTWEICDECEWFFEMQGEEDPHEKCTCYQDEKDLNCPSCFGGDC